MDQPYTNGDPISPQPTVTPRPNYSTPTHSDLAAVAATVSVVGVLMAVLLVWLIARLRRAESQQEHQPITRRPTSNTSYIVRPSLAPSEASSRFGFIRKPLRLSRRHQSDSWDFADPDPFNAHPKEGAFDMSVDAIRMPKERPAPLKLVPTYTPPSPRAHSTFKDELGPRTPTTPVTPASTEFIEPPPPAYCRNGLSSPLHQPTPKDRSPP